MAWPKSSAPRHLYFFSLFLTTTVLCMNGVAIVTRLAHLAVGATGVALATETCPCDDITVPRLIHVHITVALAADACPAHFLWISVKTAGTPGGETDRWTDRWLVSQELRLIGCRLLDSVAPPTSHNWSLCSPADTGHMTPGLKAPACRLD